MSNYVTLPQEGRSNSIKIALIFLAVLVVVGVSSAVITMLQNSDQSYNQSSLSYVIAIAFAVIIGILIYILNRMIRKRNKSPDESLQPK